MSEVDKVTLSVRELQQLAAIQAMVEARDPELARTLTGHKGSVQAALRRASQVALVWAQACSSKGWLGLLLFVVGFVVIFGTLAVQPWISLVGVLMAAAGLGLAIHAWQRRWDSGASRRPVGRSVGD
jgi:hypothetical protein